MKVSFIFSREELAVLLRMCNTAEMSEAIHLFCEGQLPSSSGEDVAEGLLFRKMARKVGGQLLLEPVIRLIMNNLWAASECLLMQETAYLFRCPQMVVRLEPYRHAEGEWRLTPYELEEGEILMSGGTPWPDCISM